jgi:hypothetical protein
MRLATFRPATDLRRVGFALRRGRDGIGFALRRGRDRVGFALRRGRRLRLAILGVLL